MPECTIDPAEPFTVSVGHLPAESLTRGQLSAYIAAAERAYHGSGGSMEAAYQAAEATRQEKEEPC